MTEYGHLLKAALKCAEECKNYAKTKHDKAEWDRLLKNVRLEIYRGNNDAILPSSQKKLDKE